MNWRADERGGGGGHGDGGGRDDGGNSGTGRGDGGARAAGRAISPRRAGHRHSEWRAVGAVLKLPLGAERPAEDAAQQRLAEFWARHFGQAAARATPLLLDSGRLVVVVEAAAWGHEIRHRAPGLLAELARAGIDAASVTVKVRPPLPAPPPRRARPPLRLSPASAARLESLAATVAHPPLAAALRSLAKKAEGG